MCVVSFATAIYQPAEYNHFFTLQEKLGEGDKSFVYAAQDMEGKRYALKLYRSPQELQMKGIPEEVIPYFFDENGLSRFGQREHEIGNILMHPAFMRVFGVVVIEGKTALVMEWIDGTVVSEAEPSLSCFQTAIDGLLFAIQYNYVSSDLYSENAMIDRAGNFKFIDLDSFDFIDSEVEEETIEKKLSDYFFFLRALLPYELWPEFERSSQRYKISIQDRLKNNLSPENLYLIADYLQSQSISDNAQ